MTVTKSMNDFIRASARGVEPPETPRADAPAPGPDADIATLRRVIAARLNVPEILADRLRGDTPEAIEADAVHLQAELLRAAAKPPGNAGNGARQTGHGKLDMNAFIRRQAGKGGNQ